MKTRCVIGLLVLSVVGVLGMVLHPATSHASTVGQELFFDDFETASGLPAGWRSDYDAGISCSAYPTTADDASTYVVSGDYWPNHGRVMTVHANVHSEPATYVNALAIRPFTYQGGGNYHAELDMRLWKIDSVYANSYYGMNLTVSRNHVDHYAEVNIETNPYNPNGDYGYLMYKRMNSSGQVERARIAYVGVNTNWHRLIANVYVDVAANYYRLESVSFDGTWYTLQVPLPYRSVPITWSDYNHLFMESHALWTKCDPSITHVGIAVFDNIRLIYYPW